MVEITLALPEKVFHHASCLSRATQLNISNILADTLAFTLPTLEEAMSMEPPRC
jgi:hypothetical protein